MMTTMPTAHIDAHLNLPLLAQLRDDLPGKLAGALVQVQLANRELSAEVHAVAIAEVLTKLRDDRRWRFTQLTDVCGVDWLGIRPAAERFAVVYHLLSLEQNLRLRVVCRLPEGDAAQPPTLPSVVGVFPNANWYERETYDLYGIVFAGHPDLRRLLTDYGFDGHPLRKDFPLEGHVEVYYDAAQQRVAYKPVDLPQDFRHFDMVSRWEGMTGNAHLAEEDAATYKREEFK